MIDLDYPSRRHGVFGRVNPTEVKCSVAYLAEAWARPNLEILTNLCPMPTDADGNLEDERVNRVSLED